MILSGPRIHQACAAGDIVIDPFDIANLNPNSYNFHLGDEILQVCLGPDGRQVPKPLRCVRCFSLQPGILYLASMHEFVTSRRYVVTLLGRSSVGRLGLFLNISADLGHAGSASRWTLELKVVQPLRVYPRMPIGQLAFWVQSGTPSMYGGRYQNDRGPVPSRDFDEHRENPTSDQEFP